VQRLAGPPAPRSVRDGSPSAVAAGRRAAPRPRVRPTFLLTLTRLRRIYVIADFFDRFDSFLRADARSVRSSARSCLLPSSSRSHTDRGAGGWPGRPGPGDVRTSSSRRACA
jgi:hypothetical protein